MLRLVIHDIPVTSFFYKVSLCSLNTYFSENVSNFCIEISETKQKLNVEKLETRYMEKKRYSSI